MFLRLVIPSNDRIILPDIHGRHPSQPQTPSLEPESPLLSRAVVPIRENGTVPPGITKPNPSFHFLVRGSTGSPSLCRTISSAMILNYPPPTLIDNGESSSRRIGRGTQRTNAIPVINRYLTDKRFKDNDVVLIVNSDDFWFQLPPELMLQRFHALLRKNNDKLKKVYGTVEEEGTPTSDTIQKHSQRIIFGASKNCRQSRLYDPACIAVPPSTLYPDIYGPHTDRSKDKSKNRPRWLDSGVVIGLAGDMRRLYSQASQLAGHGGLAISEQQIMTLIFGEQEYVRELERQISPPSQLRRLAEALGIVDRLDISQIRLGIVPEQRYDYSMGLDYESELFFTTSYSENDIEWLYFNNITKLLSVQLEHKVPRESRLNLPADIEGYTDTPFPRPSNNEISKTWPPYNPRVDFVPNKTWHEVPLAVNVHSTSIPALLNINSMTVRSNSLSVWWKQMWYHPWFRAMLRRYIRFPRGTSSAVASMLGASEAWDMRGGVGGVWTANNEWMAWSEICEGFEEEIFGDGLGPWGSENDDDDN
ncbi:hypothetical protein AJ80_07342 [Polytolypa hystricis UAMH7299]|uniref:Uncharacterized protein n=1 Tax=Polytolypa hystricis (strain UAMH7299) TaxID=1447883 RepID=A0A2B7XPI8_POLH7|nr:hypothetical protein AJ80_07342 [Polytolypa hystricis UAMH7299]